MMLWFSFLRSALFCKIELQLLMNLTTRAFCQPSVRIWTYSNEEALRIYCEYTSNVLRTGVDDELLIRMNTEAYRMGHSLRRFFCIRKHVSAERFVVALYHNIGINLIFKNAQHLCFRRCYFSYYYTPAVCLAASSLDDGIIRGLFGLPFSRLHFLQRITEGCPCCEAVLLETN